MTKKRQQSWHDFYDEIESIREGGNAEVFRVKQKSTGDEFALTELQYNKKSEEKSVGLKMKLQ